MKKYLGLLAASLFLFSSCGMNLGDEDFRETVEFVQLHSSREYVEQMKYGEQSFKPSDWLSVFRSPLYTATHIPEEPMKVVMLAGSFSDNKNLQNFYAPGLKYLEIIPDDKSNTVTVKGYKGWQTKVLFEKSWQFNE